MGRALIATQRQRKVRPRTHKSKRFETAKLYLNIARNEANPDDKKIQKQIAKTEKKIDKAEIAFAKRMKKDSQKKRFFKEDREMQN